VIGDWRLEIGGLIGLVDAITLALRRQKLGEHSNFSTHNVTLDALKPLILFCCWYCFTLMPVLVDAQDMSQLMVLLGRSCLLVFIGTTPNG
jgi:ammonia channel protein AmtB